MCGICGKLNFTGIEVAWADIKTMTDAMVHRGPDASGYHVEGAVGLGHRRLSIIDLSTQGQQPLANENGDIWIVFNGEIYNYLELKNRLAGRHTFRTATDTEAIVHLYEEEGVECVSHLDGMFAFAIWDGRQSRLFLARDRLGKKPLYYYQDRESFSFASELKALLTNPAVPREIDTQAVLHYLRYGYVPTPDVIYRGMRKLEPGHFLVVNASGSVKGAAYWQLRFTEDLPEDEARITEEVRHLVRAAVEKRLMSDVPLGAFLSGGVDSSLVVGVMSEVVREPVKTFTIGFEEEKYNEVTDAEFVSSHFRTDHRVQYVHAEKIDDLLPRLVNQFDEPFSDPSAIPTYYVCRFAREFVTVALSGDGGDEVFAGYRRYFQSRQDALALKLPTGLLTGLGRLAESLPEGVKGKRYLEYISQHSLGRYRTRVGVFDDSELRRLLVHDLHGQLDLMLESDPLATAYHSHQQVSALSAMQYADIKTYLLDDILVKVDRMSMLNSLEVRVPLLDYKLIEYAARIPASLRARDGRGKYILRRAFERLLPARTMEKPKQGFGVPLEFWFRGSLASFAEENLKASELDQFGLFQRKAVQKLLQDHQAGTRDNSKLLWNLLNLVYWRRSLHQASRAA